MDSTSGAIVPSTRARPENQCGRQAFRSSAGAWCEGTTQGMRFATSTHKVRARVAKRVTELRLSRERAGGPLYCAAMHPLAMGALVVVGLASGAALVLRRRWSWRAL